MKLRSNFRNRLVSLICICVALLNAESASAQSTSRNQNPLPELVGPQDSFLIDRSTIGDDPFQIAPSASVQASETNSGSNVLPVDNPFSMDDLPTNRRSSMPTKTDTIPLIIDPPIESLIPAPSQLPLESQATPLFLKPELNGPIGPSGPNDRLPPNSPLSDSRYHLPSPDQPGSRQERYRPDFPTPNDWHPSSRDIGEFHPRPTGYLPYGGVGIYGDRGFLPPGHRSTMLQLEREYLEALYRYRQLLEIRAALERAYRLPNYGPPVRPLGCYGF